MSSDVQCGKFICKYDMISYDDLQPDVKCVSLSEDECVACDTVNDALKSNQINFYKNPGKLLFGKNLSDEELDNLWEQLSESCGIKYIIIAEEEKTQFIAPDVDMAHANYQSIISNISSQQLNNYIKSMMDIIYTSNEISVSILKTDNIDDYIHRLRTRYRTILDNGGWSCFLVHNPLELPYVLAVIFQKLVDDPRNMKIFIELLSSTMQVCAEAQFQFILDKLL